MRKRATAIVLALFALIGGASWNGCTRPEKSRPDEGKKHRVVLISLDTLRADALGAYDSTVDTTRHIDRFASESVVFADTLATAPSTVLSHKSILTSFYPSVHKANRKFFVVEFGPSPIESMQDAGLTTGAITAGGAMSSKFGFGRGFDSYFEVESNTRRQGNEIPVLVDEVTHWIAEHHQEPFFLFIHTYQPHFPYDPPDDLERKHAGWYDGRLLPSGNEGPRYDENPMGPEDYRFLQDLYSAEVEYTDSFVGSVLAELDRHGIGDETIVVLLSDHGEAFGERGLVGHNHLHDFILRTPLVIRAPGMAPRRVDSPVSLIDVMPTIFDLLGIEPPYDFQGESLVPFLHGENPWGRERIRIAEKEAFSYVQRHPYALRYDPLRNSSPALFDIELDPEEQNDIAGLHNDIVGELIDHHAGVLEEGQPYGKWFLIETDNPQMDEETTKQLRQLGYVK